MIPTPSSKSATKNAQRNKNSVNYLIVYILENISFTLNVSPNTYMLRDVGETNPNLLIKSN